MFLHTSEGVCKGHPDKVADFISDSILDAIKAVNGGDHTCACEVMVTGNSVFISGETSLPKVPDFTDLVKSIYRDIGYDKVPFYDIENLTIVQEMQPQSEEIELSVFHAEEHDLDQESLGAGDQGIVCGYATDETEQLLPMSHLICCQLTHKIDHDVHKVPWLYPDAKVQITLGYEKDAEGGLTVVTCETFLVSLSHAKDTLKNVLTSYVHEELLPIIHDALKGLSPKRIIINPSGSFVMCGPAGDTGLTGRKIVFDTYGSWVPHGGGAFSGKDLTKVDRSGAYFARFLAERLVKEKVCRRCCVQMAFGIGLSEVLSLTIEDYGSSKLTQQELTAKALNLMPCASVSAMINYVVNHMPPSFSTTTNNGHLYQLYLYNKIANN